MLSIARLEADVRIRSAFLIASAEACDAITDAAFLKTKGILGLKLSLFDVVQMQALERRFELSKCYYCETKYDPNGWKLEISHGGRSI